MKRRISSKAIWAGALASAGLAAWVARDYAKWRALGPGGLPSNLQGWVKMTRYRWMAHNELDARPLAALAGAHNLMPGAAIGARSGMRPVVSPYPIPHRQLDQLPDLVVREALSKLFDDTVDLHQGQVRFALSHFERRHPAITLLDSHGKVGAGSFGEIAHIHPSDFSMHMVLSPADAVQAIHLGWARRHGLAGRAVGLPVTYVMIYAPRNIHDLETISKLLDAAVAYAVQPIGHERS